MDDLGAAIPSVGTDALRDPPTGVRWRILALLMAYAALCHFNRISISVAGTEHIMKDFSISETRMGMVYTAYLLVYMLCMIPGGWLIDRYGPKRALMLMGFGSAILVPLTGLTGFLLAASVYPALCLIRGLLGLVSAPMHPGAARAVSFWQPPQARGAANGMVTGAAVVGVASTYFVFGFLMDLVGWPAAFLVAGIATLLLTLVWSAYATDHPGQHPGVNASERRRIEEGSRAPDATGEDLARAPGDPSGDLAAPGPGSSGIEGRAGFMALLRNRNLALLTISYAAYSYFQYLFFYWTQYYFDEVLMLDKADARLYATIPTLAMAAGMVSGGWIADRITARWAGRHGRAVTPSCSMFAGAVFLGLGILGGPPGWVVACFALALGALGASESSFWVTGIELGGRRGGMSGAVLNAGGNLGGLLAPVITPFVSSYFGWQAGLGVAGVICFLGAALWWWIDPDEKQGSPDPELAGVAAIR